MNESRHHFIKRAITNYGIRISENVLWFIDDGIIYFGLEWNGEIIHYLSGFITGNIFVVIDSTQKEKLDITGWDAFIANHLEMRLLDARN